MKKIIILSVLAFALISCSSDDESSSGNSSEITPPSWIQGTWIQEGVTGFQLGYIFTSDDFCSTIVNSATCFKETINLYEGTDVFTNVNQEISDTNYSIEITISDSVQSYSFEKVSNTEISLLNGTVDITYIKQ